MPARITAAPIPIKFIDGTTFQFSPLTDRDLDEMDEWLRACIMENALESIPASANQAQRDELLAVAGRRADLIAFLSPDGAAMVATLKGMTHLLWMSIRKMHPDVTEESLLTIIRDPRNLQILNAKFRHANEPPPKVNSGNRKRASRLQK